MSSIPCMSLSALSHPATPSATSVAWAEGNRVACSDERISAPVMGAERGERWGSARRVHAMITHADCGLGHAEKQRRCGDERTPQAVIQPKVMSSYSYGGRLNKMVLHDRTGHCHSVTMSSGTYRIMTVSTTLGFVVDS